MVYIIAWSYGIGDVKSFETYFNNKYKKNKKIKKATVDGKTSEWTKKMKKVFNKRSSFARAAKTKRRDLKAKGIPASDIKLYKINNKQDLSNKWNEWAKLENVEGLDFYSHGRSSDGAPEAYGGSSNFWNSGIKKLQWGSTIRQINGKGVVSSSYAKFYGCNTGTGTFGQNFANKQGVTTYGQPGYSSFSSTSSGGWAPIVTHKTSLGVYMNTYYEISKLNLIPKSMKVFYPKK